MEDPATKLDTLLNHLKEFTRYHTGYPRKEHVSRVVEFKSERQFVELLHQGEPVAVAFTLKCPWTRRFDRVLEDAAAESFPHIKFVRMDLDFPIGPYVFSSSSEYVMRSLSFVHFYFVCDELMQRDKKFSFILVECPKYPGFCIARQRKDYPFVEIFHSPQPAQAQESVKDRSISRYSVNVTPYNYDMSAYGFREFFKRHKTAFQAQDI